MECISDPDSTVYNLPFLQRLSDDTDIDRMVNALRKVLKAHPVLSARLKEAAGGEILLETAEAPEISITTLSDETFAKQKNSLVRPFILESGPLARFEIFITPSAKYYFQDIHHLINDGTTLKILSEDLAAAYVKEELPTEEYTVFDVSDDELKARKTPEFEAQKEYYIKLLEGAETDCAPEKDSEQTEKEQGWIEEDFTLEEGALNALKEKRITSPGAFFTSVMGFVTARYNYTKTSVISTVWNGREDPRVSRTAGMFVKTIPFVTDFSTEDSVEALLRTGKSQLTESRKRTLYSFADIAADPGACADVLFVFQGELLNHSLAPWSDYEPEWIHDPKHIEAAKLTFELYKKAEGRYSVRLGYRKDYYTEFFARGFAKAYIRAVRSFPERDLLKDVSLIDEAEISLLDSFNRTEHPYDKKTTVVELFRNRAEQNPEQTAVIVNERRISYSELDRVTDALAARLKELGVEREKVVGVLVPRNEYMVIGALGVLKAGGAWLPMDPTYPPERLNLMMDDSGACVLIADPALKDMVSEELQEKRILTTEIEALPEAKAQELPAPEDLFVVLYTSGTTGKPKGVMFTHGNMMALSAAAGRRLALDESCVYAQFASFGFDAFTLDVFPTLAAGGGVCIVPEEIRLDLVAVSECFRKNKVTHTTMTTQLGRQFAALKNPGSLRTVVCGGEKLASMDPPDYQFLNAYGPSECTVVTSWFSLDRRYQNIPIGTPLDNLKLYVVDTDGNRLPAGAAGELWVSGPQVTRGYLNRPEKTAEVYAANPFGTDPDHMRIFRTGDVVRYLPDGNLQFVGRRDLQVKIRGFRIELSEVEEVIRRFPGVKDAAVSAYDSPGGGKFLTAYVVSGQEVDVKALEEFILEEKPPYMVPAVTMQIDAIPYTQNHKVNKRALPYPERTEEEITEPENEMQERILAKLKDVLKEQRIGIDTNIFLAGLTSIGLARLNVLLSEEFGTALKLSELRSHDTVRKLEELLSVSERESTDYELLADYPITQTQKGIFVESSFGADSVTYNIPILIRLDPRVDLKRLEEALRTAVDAHPYLKTTLFSGEEGDIRARRNDEDPVHISSIIAEKLPSSEQLVRPFRLLEHQLYRAEIYRTEDGNYLFLDIHHILADGFSEVILLQDISRAYEGAPVEKERFTGFEMALEEEKERKTGHYEEARAWYDSVFKGCEPECMPPKDGICPEPLAGSVKKEAAADAAAVLAFCERNRLTPNALFNAAFGYTLCRFSMTENAVFTTVYNGRSDSRLSSAVTMLVKTLPVLIRFDGDRELISLIRSTQEQLLESMSNDLYSFAEVSAAYGIRSDVLFAYQGDNFNFDSLCGYPAEFTDISPDNAKAKITVTAELRDGKFDLSAQYRTDLYSRELIESLLDALAKAVCEFAVKKNLSEVSLVSDAAAGALAEINATERAFENIPAHAFFERHAARNPEKTAVMGSGRELTYGGLNRLANRAAHTLIGLGTEKDSIVGILLERTVDISVFELAVLKAGGAFLPMLPSYPDDRLDYCLQDSGSRIVITTKEIRDARTALFSEDKPYRAVTVEELLENGDEKNPNLPVSPDSLVYCIYTSGTTGKPKGVMLEHHNLSSLIQQDDHTPALYYGKDGGEVSLAMSSFSFDMSIMENFLFLACGKTVYIATEDEVHNPAALAQIITEHRIDTISATPSLYTNYLEIAQYRNALGGIRCFMAGAEPFPPKLYHELRKAAPNAVILNAYGPTEITICSSIKKLEGDKNITIGAPLANLAYYITDPFGNILPPYACGELIICGEQVSRGYVNLPEKNAEAYFTLNGMRAYHSGDFGRLNADGEADCLGRMDDQVKLRGFRIELGEIERRMNAFEGIKRSKVIVRNNGSEDYLAGFFTAEGKIDTDSLRAFLKETLNYYMIPDVLMQLDSMPLNPSGKVDKKALPETKKETRKAGKKKPKKSLEQELTELFGKVLSLDEVYADDNFFEIGGTSLSASKVVMQLMSKGYKIDYQNIFDHPTPESLAEYIEAQSAAAPAPSKPSEERKTEGASLKPVSPYADLLKNNTLEYAAEAVRKPLGDVLLTGAVGFLGIHVFKALLDAGEGRIICLLRSRENTPSERRLKNMLMYYFGRPFEKELKERVTIVDADITDDALPSVLEGIRFQTIINCAAIVKHYAADDQIEITNVHGVENLIRCAKERKTRLVQISTVSIPGIHTEETYKARIKMYENELFTIQTGDNKYLLSKLHAEEKMLEAIRDGMDGKIIRVGNLMGRYSDGEFQINSNTNAFLNAVRGFAVIGKFPLSHATDPISFSPIDLTAEAIVKLSGTNREFTVFNADNRIVFDEMQLIDALNRCGIPVKPVSDEEYYAEYRRLLGDEKMNENLSGLLTNDNPGVHMAETDNTFSANVLYRLGFSWPLVDSAYLEKIIDALSTLDFFSV